MMCRGYAPHSPARANWGYCLSQCFPNVTMYPGTRDLVRAQTLSWSIWGVGAGLRFCIGEWATRSCAAMPWLAQRSHCGWQGLRRQAGEKEMSSAEAKRDSVPKHLELRVSSSCWPPSREPSLLAAHAGHLHCHGPSPSLLGLRMLFPVQEGESYSAHSGRLT